MNVFKIYCLFILAKVYLALGDCGTFTDCYNCSYSTDPNCEWKGGECKDAINKPGSFNPFYTQFDNCNDNKSIRLREKYCGSNTLILDDKKAEASLPLVEGKYGTPYILCKYTFINDDEKNNIIINIKIRRGSQTDSLVYIEARFFDETIAERLVDKYDFLVGVEKGREVDFYYFTKSAFDEKPFMLYLKIEKPGISVTLIVTIVLVIAACLICSVSVYVFSRRIAQRNRMQRTMIMGSGIIVNGQAVQVGGGAVAESEEDIKKRKMIQLETLLSTTMLLKDYNEDLAKYNNNCTICIEEYTKLSTVCLTPCNHVFHYDCIKSWLSKNLLNSKCPNCNFHLLPEATINLNDGTRNNNQQQHQVVNNVYVSASYPNAYPIAYPPQQYPNPYGNAYPPQIPGQQPIGSNVPYSSIHLNNMPQVDINQGIQSQGEAQAQAQLQPLQQLPQVCQLQSLPNTQQNMSNQNIS